MSVIASVLSPNSSDCIPSSLGMITAFKTLAIGILGCTLIDCFGLSGFPPLLIRAGFGISGLDPSTCTLIDCFGLSGFPSLLIRAGFGISGPDPSDWFRISLFVMIG